MMKKLLKLALVPTIVAAATFSTTVNAGFITCGSLERTGTLNSATECRTGAGNGTAAVADVLYSDVSTSWTELNEETGSGTGFPLDVTLTAGSWGSSPIEGTWTIDASFWTTYGDAIISMHVGNGNGDPDHWMWKIEEGTTSGTFSYEDFDGRGGGLSNLKLFGANDPMTPPPSVPEPSSLALLGLGLVGVGLSRRRLARK